MWRMKWRALCVRPNLGRVALRALVVRSLLREGGGQRVHVPSHEGH